jgi:hypothetical protein
METDEELNVSRSCHYNKSCLSVSPFLGECAFEKEGNRESEKDAKNRTCFAMRENVREELFYNKEIWTSTHGGYGGEGKKSEE